VIKQFEPHDVAKVSDWIKRAGKGYQRLLAFMPVGNAYLLCAYSCKGAEPELEAEIAFEGGRLVGYYRPPLDVMQLMEDLVETWRESN
jgi:hypothetical protein